MLIYAIVLQTLYRSWMGLSRGSMLWLRIEHFSIWLLHKGWFWSFIISLRFGGVYHKQPPHCSSDMVYSSSDSSSSADSPPVEFSSPDDTISSSFAVPKAGHLERKRVMARLLCCCVSEMSRLNQRKFYISSQQLTFPGTDTFQCCWSNVGHMWSL